MIIFEKKHHLVQFPKVAVVILNWNGRRYMEQFLAGVVDSGYANLEVVVADNASTDDSVQWLQTQFPSIKLIILKENYGFAGGYNKALKQVEADYYILLNNDVEVKIGWITPAIEMMEADKNIAAVQPKILSYAQKDQFEYAGASGGWIDKYGFPFARGRVFDVCETDNGQYNDNQPVFWASGAALFIRSTAFHTMNGFDEYFFAHQEEIDLCWRLQNAGHSVWVCPASVVYHVGGGTLPTGNPRKVFLNFRNNLVMMQKNLPRKGRFGRMFIRLSQDGLAAMRFLFSGKGRSFWAIMRAHYYYYAWCWSGRERPKQRKPMEELNGYYSGSVVWAYFVKKKKTFRDIISS